MKKTHALLLLASVTWSSFANAVFEIQGIYSSDSVEAQVIVLDWKLGSDRTISSSTIAVSLISTAKNCYSRVTGIGELKGRVLKFSPIAQKEGQEKCEVDFEFDNSKNSFVVAERGCANYRAAKCPFDGQTAIRQQIPRERLTQPASAVELNPTQARIQAMSIVGKYEYVTTQQNNSQTIRLECETEINCTFTSIFVTENSSPRTDKQVLKKVREVGVPSEVHNALSYTINQRNRPIRNEEFAKTMSDLSPILSRSPHASKCWDLNYPTRDYMLACKLSIGTKELPGMYLFATLLANCGEAFCRFVISPMAPVE